VTTIVFLPTLDQGGAWASPSRADTLKGGADTVALRAVDGKADRLVDCGGNTDKVYYDVGLDPEPVNCEVLNP
jgi:hypothetical protein